MPKNRLTEQFKKTIWKYHSENRRDLPWRNTHDPYKILVSEMMLQQTQVSRVLIKYKSFLKKFPNAKALASAPLRDVLLEWQGLGYNRRAMYLKKTAEVVTKELKGRFPNTAEALMKLPGIGQSTAGALIAFSHNKPSVFIETNIRSVFMHFFFKNTSSVSDTMIKELVEETLDTENSREWYYALYDYGTMLKKSSNKETRSIHRNSKHYKKQSKFAGSNRELRSKIIKYLLSSKITRNINQISKEIGTRNDLIEKNLKTMQKEGLILLSPKGWKTA